MSQLEQLYSLYRQHPEVTTDSRQAAPGKLYFALRGERFDGNRFALAALEAGCEVAVVDDASLPCDPRLVRVENVLETLQQLAALHRRTLGTPTLQITGTNGKTTTKELTAAVLSKGKRVLFTQGNLNNHIGVPLTLLRLQADDEVAVVETGANHPGEIAFLSRIVAPDCGLITNVGTAHLAGFGSFEGVVKTKTELYRYLAAQPKGLVFLHIDNPHLRAAAEGLDTFTYGAAGSGAKVEGELTGHGAFLAFRFRVDGGEWHAVQTQLVGAYNLANALAAIAVGTYFGIAPQAAVEALEAYRPTNNRSQWTKTEHNELIVDAYNANPTSMHAALSGFAAMAHARKCLILGEMRELGEASAAEHAKVAAEAASAGAEEVWLVGDAFRPFAAETGAQWFADVEAVKAHIAAQPPRDCLFLIKGSNGTRLFELPQLL